MRKQTTNAKSSPPPVGGRRNHSRFAPLYEEICRLRARRLTWQEIADKLSVREGEKLNRTALWKMWDNRQRGAVRREFPPAASVDAGTPDPVNASFNLVTAAASAFVAPVAGESEDELLGIAPASPPKVVMKVRQAKSGNRPV